MHRGAHAAWPGRGRCREPQELPRRQQGTWGTREHDRHSNDNSVTATPRNIFLVDVRFIAYIRIPITTAPGKKRPTQRECPTVMQQVSKQFLFRYLRQHSHQCGKEGSFNESQRIVAHQHPAIVSNTFLRVC